MGQRFCSTVVKHAIYRVDEALDLWILSSCALEGGKGDETAAWYDEEASWANAGTVPPASIILINPLSASLSQAKTYMPLMYSTKWSFLPKWFNSSICRPCHQDKNRRHLPVNPAQADENTITGGVCISKNIQLHWDVHENLCDRVNLFENC